MGSIAADGPQYLVGQVRDEDQNVQHKKRLLPSC